jgi:hypothetical protein
VVNDQVKIDTRSPSSNSLAMARIVVCARERLVPSNEPEVSTEKSMLSGSRVAFSRSGWKFHPYIAKVIL